ncbi:MAG TPA: hypothetical protein VFD43_01410, partial [Planctomycetota bacterium]|nr:hypothetical protein [Planctomycetota bacterium]
AASAASAPAPGMRLGFDLTTVRALLTNFDVGLLFLLAAAVTDLCRDPFVPFEGWPPLSARALWLAFYAINLPLNFLDYVRTYMRRGHFASETERLLVLAHHYKLEAEAKDRDGR